MSCDPLANLAEHLVAHQVLGTGSGGSGTCTLEVYTTTPTDDRPSATVDNAYKPFIVRNAGEHARGEMVVQRADDTYAYWIWFQQF